MDGDGVQTLSPRRTALERVAGRGGHGMNVLWLNAGLLCRSTKEASCARGTSCASSPGGITSAISPSRIRRNRSRPRRHARSVSALETVPRRDPPKGTWRFRLDAARYIPQPVPYAIAKYRSAAYRQRVSDLLRHRRFDVIVCDFLVPLVNLPGDLPCPTVLFTHNVEAEIWRRHAETAVDPLAVHCCGSSGDGWSASRARALARCDLVLAVSHADVATFSRLYPGARAAPMHVVQTGVDTEYFSPGPARDRAAAPRLHRLDGLAAERGRRCSTSSDDILPAFERSSPP